VKFVIGGGIVVDFQERDEATLIALDDFWSAFQRETRWFSFVREFVTRGFRDGEVFVRRFPRQDMSLALRFIDPEKVPEIKTDPNDAETALSYAIEFGTKRLDVDAGEILHVALNVDRNVQRGRPILESILPHLAKYDKWMDARMVLNIVRASVALVQEVQGSSTDLLRLRAAQRATSSASETDKSRMLRPGTILRGTPGVKYSMLSPNLDARDAATDGRTILLAVAAAAGFPDIFVTADYARANFASTLSAHNPAIREFEDWQHVYGEAFTTIVDWVLADAMARRVLPLRTSKGKPVNLGIDVAFPPLLKRDLAQEVTAYAQLVGLQAMSRRTLQLRMGLDPDQEQKLIDEEGPLPIQTVKPAAKQPGDKGPRQQSTGEEGKKMSVRVRRAKEKVQNGTDHDFDLEFAVPLAPTEVEMGGDGFTE
ncbi:MAG: phage portal protein, partial [bacterium]|nr:phage portal protein [bacterium]